MAKEEKETKKEKKLAQLERYEQSQVRIAEDETAVQYVKDNIDKLWLGQPGDQHGDFHPGNILLTPDHRAVVIDFMNVCRGPALYDIARTYFLLKEKDEAFGRAYLAKMEVSEEELLPFYTVIERCRMYER